MTSIDISNTRLNNQQISKTKFLEPKDIVSWMGAMQAQDFLMAKWAVGLRLKNANEKSIEDAYNKGDIIRTHLLRPTWHFVSCDDIYWMIELTGHRILSSMRTSHAYLELIADVINKSMDIITNALIERSSLTRQELEIELNLENINTDNFRMSHLLFCAELQGLVCSGGLHNGKITYSLLSERVPKKKTLTKDESLAELAKRYFTSHAPAAIKDFRWWSGLTLNDIRKALDFVKSDIISEKVDSETYFLPYNFNGKIKTDESIYLLPAFDEFLISYANRDASLAQVNNKKAISNNGMFHPVIVYKGQVIGLWKRMLKKDKVIINIELFRTLNKTSQVKIEKRAEKYGDFLEKKVEKIEFK